MDLCTINKPPAAPASVDITSTSQNPSPDGLSCLRNRFVADNISEEELVPRNNIPPTFKSGWTFVVKGRLLVIHQQ
jgi:hypothetical protein